MRKIFSAMLGILLFFLFIFFATSSKKESIANQECREYRQLKQIDDKSDISEEVIQIEGGAEEVMWCPGFFRKRVVFARPLFPRLPRNR